MIQTYKNIYNQISSIKQFDINNAQIQKIYSSSQVINIVCRKPGNTFSLYLGRGHGIEGLWLDDKKVASNLRKRDQFLEYLRKYLSTSYIHDLILSDEDRIIYLEYIKYGKINTMGFFYLGRSLYFANHYFDLKDEQFKTYCSWKSKKNENMLEENFKELTDTCELDKEKENKLIPITEIIEREEKSLTKEVNKKFKKLTRKIELIKGDLSKMENYKELYDFADSNQDLSELNKKITINGIKINFIEKEHFKRRDQLFKKAKSLKNKIEFMRNRLEKAEKENFQIKKDKLVNNLKTIKPVMYQAKSEKKLPEDKKNDFNIIEIRGLKAAIGVSAKGNDQLRKEWASKEDMWFHIDGDISPHIIIKGWDKTDEEVLTQVARLFKTEMKLNTDEINIIYTQVKNLKGVKGVKGLVNYKKEKHIRIIL
jgi:predicted ribosome quality control (RQC) complex YloA/Tae2 family protein